MDLVLSILDDLVLDRVWASLVPLSAFNSTGMAAPTANISSILPVMSTASKWTRVVACLPHPQIRPDDLASIYTTSSQTLTSISAWPRDYLPRQLVSLCAVTLLGAHALYFLFATLSYYFVFNHEMMKHPRFLKNQFAEVMGYSRLYDGLDTYGYVYLVASVPFYLLFTDYLIYWIHRWLHLPFFYKHLHKPHHKWIIPTPFASHAFHPVDGYFQSLPYHIFVFLFPLHRVLYLVLFVLINFWTIFIHDSDMVTGHPLEKVINGPAHHTLHHLYFTVNYGQYFTWADRYGGSYRQPESSLDPLLEVRQLEKESSGKNQ